MKAKTRGTLVTRWTSDELFVVGQGYSSLSSACAAIKEKDNWLDLISAGSASATCDSGAKAVTLADCNLVSTKALLPGDIWSPDGTNWYEINSVTDDTSITLRTPLMGSTITSEALLVARPRWVKLIIPSGDYDYLDFNTNGPIFVFVQADNARLLSYGAFSANAQICYPNQGHISVSGLRAESSVAVSCTFATLGSRHASSIITETNCHYKSRSVDMFAPYGASAPSPAGGQLNVVGGYRESCQDGMLPLLSEGMNLTSTTLASINAEFSSGVYWPVRMFSDNTSGAIVATGCNFYLRHDAGEPAGHSVFIDAAYVTRTAAKTFTNCNFYFKGADADKIYLVGAFSPIGNGVPGATQADITLTNCGVSQEFPSGNYTLVQAGTWTTAGELTVSGGSLGTYTEGGGGSFVVN